MGARGIRSRLLLLLLDSMRRAWARAGSGSEAVFWGLVLADTGISCTAEDE